MKDTNNSFQFQRITIVSHLEKSGRVLKIYPRTLITSKKNTIGKSTLLNCLFWGLGCDVMFEEDWVKLEISTLIEFSVNDTNYKVKRDKDSIYLFNYTNNIWNKYEVITGDYLEQLNKILNFNILLKGTNAKKLSRVPPAFYFSATYIEQMYGWNEIWQSFKSLGQFNKNNKRELTKYLCSLQNADYYENKSEINSYELKNLSISDDIKNSRHVIDYIEKFELDVKDPFAEIQSSSSEYIRAENSLREMRSKYISYSSKSASIDNEINIIMVAIGELENDYIFSVENLKDTTIYCPTCGVEHLNNLVNRFSIISDSDKLKEQLKNLKDEKQNILNKLIKISYEIENTYNTFQTSIEKNPISEILNQKILNKTLTPTIENRILNFESDIKNNKKQITSLNKTNKNIQKNNLEKIEDKLVIYFNKICKKLEVKMLPKNNLNDILEFHSGGANQIKVMLAKRLTILKAINTHAELSTPPFVVDSLRQQDLDDLNYEIMLKLLIKECPDDCQLILAAVQNSFTEAIKDDFEEITIDNSLLLSSEYQMASFLLSDTDGNVFN